MRPDGTSKTVSYSANPQLGFRSVPFGQLGVALPPFPHKLNTKNHLEKSQKEEEEEDFVVVDRGKLVNGSRVGQVGPIDSCGQVRNIDPSGSK